MMNGKDDLPRESYISNGRLYIMSALDQFADLPGPRIYVVAIWPIQQAPSSNTHLFPGTQRQAEDV